MCSGHKGDRADFREQFCQLIEGQGVLEHQRKLAHRQIQQEELRFLPEGGQEGFQLLPSFGMPSPLGDGGPFRQWQEPWGSEQVRLKAQFDVLRGGEAPISTRILPGSTL